MFYTDRKYLSILTLTEERDYVTYDELIHVLKARPSNAVYIERDGILCGLITSGRIGREHNEKARRVPFNKKFTSVYPGEHMRVRQIFRDKENINMVPVVSEDGHLLGDYVRWNDFIGTDYAELLLKDPHVLHGLKEEIQNAIFVEPCCPRGGGKTLEMSLWWRRRLESEGIYLQAIQHGEIKDYRNTFKYFIFVDENEMNGIRALDHYLYHQRPIREYITITDYLCLMRQFTLARLNGFVLKELQNHGILVLAYDFEENRNHFLTVLNERIRKRNDEYGVDSAELPEKLKKSFADELYCEAYRVQRFPLSLSYYMWCGIPILSDIETEFLHIHDGERLTVNQPEQYDRCIYLYGRCPITGVYVSDQYTISSFLQRELNQAGYSCKVVNYGFPGEYLSLARIQLGSFKQGDIVILPASTVILAQESALIEDFPILNFLNALEEHDAPADWFVDCIDHCNHKANQVYAQEIYKELIPILQQLPGERIPVELRFDYIDRFYLGRYFSDFDPTNCRTVGSIVMNCNPFTLGHRFLIEEALKTVDFLIIFVVEEDESLFAFQERFAMVCQGTSDLERVMVVPSGPYILSKNTFPEYFQKIDDEDLKKNTEDDITLFAEKIAPKLGITYRFVGEEREDKVTNEYNEAMKIILPRYGIQVVEIPRKVNAESVISASRVRYCLSMNQMEKLDELVPASTKRILFYEIK